MRICTRCYGGKKLSDFYIRKGRHQRICKSCEKIASMVWQVNHPERRSITDRKFHKKWRKNNPKLKRKESIEYFNKYPQRASAVRKLNYAVQKGYIDRTPCVVCSDPKSHGHHPDYNKPLEVIWLCSSHHKKIHLGLIKI